MSELEGFEASIAVRQAEVSREVPGLCVVTGLDVLLMCLGNRQRCWLNVCLSYQRK